jgi:hypothetical protein
MTGFEQSGFESDDPNEKCFLHIHMTDGDTKIFCYPMPASQLASSINRLLMEEAVQGYEIETCSDGTVETVGFTSVRTVNIRHVTVRQGAT